MKIDELIELSRQGKLLLEKTEGNTYRRHIPIYSKTKGEILFGKFYGDIEGYRQILYKRPRYLARTKDMPENSFYKITKKDYNELKKIVPEIYYYKGNKLYNIRKLSGLNFCGHDFLANWKDKDEDNIEKLGKFYLKDLEIKP
jgi:hypothetical protein